MFDKQWLHFNLILKVVVTNVFNEKLNAFITVFITVKFVNKNAPPQNSIN